MAISSAGRARLLFWVALAWAPFALLWGLFNVLSFGARPAQALITGFNAIGWAAILGLGVWWVTGRLSWPASVRPSFYLAHVALALVYSSLWSVFGTFTALLLTREELAQFYEVLTAYISWRMLAGVWLYGLIAGVGYALRIREALVRQERAAIRAEALAVQAKLDALRARLDPHFFFNALNTLSGLIHRDPGEADDALDRIGQLLRRTLAADGTSPVPLADEWSFALEYLELERLRLGDRLRFEAAIDPATDRCLVPTFTIQPLVENAVRHAIAPRLAGGTLRVSAVRNDGRVRVEVHDDGPGPGPANGVPGTGQGLDLLRRRLEALYGGAARLTLETEPGGGTCATVELPAQEAR